MYVVTIREGRTGGEYESGGRTGGEYESGGKDILRVTAERLDVPHIIGAVARSMVLAASEETREQLTQEIDKLGVALSAARGSQPPRDFRPSDAAPTPPHFDDGRIELTDAEVAELRAAGR